MSFRNAINTDQILAKARAGANRGLLLGSEHVLKVAREHVPIEEATLERSGRASQDPANLRAAVSFDTPYAVIQHERLDLAHDNGRTAKYLENALNSEARTVGAMIATAVRRELGA